MKARKKCLEHSYSEYSVLENFILYSAKETFSPEA
ncbi:Hypothetical protein Minf_1125 [Methylacidiphilum infernorum V4]|uniref:Uncharacterized protein n=1 Tax=Methylacidiphilum infernorum (isolate V4) TaxID=481448 RepID=B3DV27_METI4|nr:Hypothetical protein Minf_1125 [Methylacidiphilum infernorum V4]